MNISSLIKRIFVLAALISTFTGCGSGGSGTAGSTGTSSTAGGTGSIAANLVWNGSGSAKSTAKTLFAAPAGVTNIKIFVYDSTMVSLINPTDFTVTAGVNGTGTINGIPVGTGRIVKAWGMDSGGNLLYEGLMTNITITLATATPVAVTMASITTASPPFGKYTAPQNVTLTASTPATIYYTTNGATPDTNSNSGVSPLQNIFIFGKTVIKFFSKNNLGVIEPVKFGNYSTGRP